uniref:NADH dehydrogenase subunit 2 n=1 Tax=Paranaspides williamsi TaxID=2231316 RepID=UPI002A80132A|nr:NADH dehydrogenase subunit 2 [Paranaspides williamsi]WOR81135.1 NADH dehydrogenase subunit 2 [Paranaspides williamsi]
MFLNSANTLFLLSSFLGIFLAVSSSSWLTAWIGLELNLLSFVPLISSKKDQYSSESALKYFLIQALASSTLIMAAIMSFISPFYSSVFITCSLFLKAGIAPFHFWFPTVMQGIPWLQTALLMTTQKVAPFALLSCALSTNSIFSNKMFLIAIVFSALIGAVGGFNQTLLRKLLAYSSISHMSWMLTAMIMSDYLWIVYFSFYSVISLSIISLFHFSQAFHVSNLIFKMNFSSLDKMIVLFSFLSLGGLPPFTGFVPKWILMQEMINQNMIIVAVVLLVSTLFTLYYYIYVAVNSFMFSSSKIFYYKNPLKPMPSLLIFMNFLGLLFPSFFMLV